MPQHPLYFRQLCPTFQHPPGQTMPQHVGCDTFQPPSQVLQRLASCDVPLQLRLGPQLLRRTQTQLLDRSLRDPLGDAWDGRLSLPCDIDPDQELLTLLFTADGRFPCWATNDIEIPTQQTLCIRMERDTTSLACLAAPDRDRPTPQIKVTQLDVAGLLHTQPCIDEQGQQRFITHTKGGVGLSTSRS